MMMGAGLAPVQVSADPGLSLSCLPQTAEVADLCGLMREVIATGLPDRRVQLVGPETAPETTTAIRLHVERLRKDGIVAHLEWRHPGEDWQTGETQALSVMDRDLNAGMVSRFFQSLWDASPIAR
ncbi:hypothetical protein [Rhodobacter capsulatus]|nr:hypothetical protein [Rhodobacter capsulatus]MDS0925519.1 hypothetical protein [Rhodobacter capsulatus]TQD34197.1 hypothetical protein FKW81_10825 [Rhodobacter capsulatus]